MNVLEEYRNDTFPVSHTHVIMPLISMMSAHFLVNSFTLITDMETESLVPFVKIASKFSLEMNSNKPIDERDDTVGNNYNNGYIVMEKSDLNFSKVIHKNPRLIVAIYTVEEHDPIVPGFLSELLIHPPVSFFVVPIMVSNYSSPEVTFKCLELYKPVSSVPLQAFPKMFYGGGLKWTWENENMTWHSFVEEIRNMSGVNISIAVVSQFEEERAVSAFWAGRDSFFWKSMEEQFHYRPVIRYQKLSLDKVKSGADIYRKMLQEEVDGLAVMPIITADRYSILRYILTGIDQKYHLLVRTPRYVHSWTSIFKPLTKESWIALTIAILLISITLRLSTIREKSPMEDLSSCCLTIFGFVCSQGCPEMPKNPSGCTVCYIALLFSIIIYQFYTSNFYSLLSTKEVSLPFNSMDEFLAKRTHRLLVHPETGIYTHIMAAQNGIYKKIREVLERDPLHELIERNRKTSLRDLCRGKAAILGMPAQTTQYSEFDCKLVTVDSGYFPMNTVTAFRRKFAFISQFKFGHLRLLEGGITHKFKLKYFRVHQQHITTTEVDNEPVTMVHVAFLFVVLVAAVVLSSIILGIEIMTSKAAKSKKMKKGLTVPIKATLRCSNKLKSFALPARTGILAEPTALCIPAAKSNQDLQKKKSRKKISEAVY